MADKRISQLVDRGTVANNDVVPIVVSGATTTNKATISSIQTFMQGNLDVGVTSVGITLGSSGTDVNVTGSPVTSSGNITINLPTASATNRGLLSAADWVTFNSKQDAGSFVTLDTAQTITAQKTFTTSGSSDTMIISHGSGSGFALDVLKAGNGEAIRVTKTSGSGNAMTISGGNFEAGTIVKTGGTSSQFLKADGSVDSTAYTTNTGTVTSVGLSSATSGVTIGSTPITTSGTITLAIATASGSQNGLLSSTDWTTFNNKQNALTNPVTGTGAAGQVAFWNGTNSQTGSNNLFWDNANVKLGIGISTPEATGLTVAGGGILVSLDSGAARKVLELYATSTGAKVSSTYVGASSYGSLELLTSNVPRLTITAAGDSTFSGTLSGTSGVFSGNVGINGSPGTAFPLEAYINSSTAHTTSSRGNVFRVYNTSATANTYSGIEFVAEGTGNAGVAGINAVVTGSGSAALSFYTRDSNTFLERFRIASTGAATFSSSVTASGIISSEDVRIYRSASNTTGYINFGSTGTNYFGWGGSGFVFNGNINAAEATFSSTVETTGIKFPATQVASADANTLDDYEEGTWTPVLSFAGGTTGITYSEQNGKYTKIGRQVTVEVEIALTSKGSSVGRVQIGNLPFGGIAAIFTAAIELRNVTFTQKYAIAEVGRASGNFFRVIFIDSASNSSECTDAETANNSVFFFSATYFV